MIGQICNKCGKRLDPWDSISCIHFERDLGYGSQYDGCSVEIDLCNSCFDAFINECAVSPLIDLGL